MNNKENIRDSMRTKLLFCQDASPNTSHNLMVNTVPHMSLQWSLHGIKTGYPLNSVDWILPLQSMMNFAVKNW